MVQTRALPYDGIDANWEEQQFQAFQHMRRTHTDMAAYTDFVFGRLLEGDLHQSCRPMLPPNVSELHGVTIQGVCILQIVDIVNIGANFEHRKEDLRGPTRTLKICFTDGHQLVFGFEHRWLPNFSMSLLHGTKVVVQNVDIRHGLLMLAPQSCRLLGVSGNGSLEQSGKTASVVTTETLHAASSGAYAAALMTSQFTAGPTTSREHSATYPSAAGQPHNPPISGSARLHSPSAMSAPRQQNPPSVPPIVAAIPVATDPGRRGNTSSYVQIRTSADSVNQERSPGPAASSSTQSYGGSAANEVTPPVFVDVISSDEDCDSDMTDPMVEHLFYSPSTPRLPADSTSTMRSRKRPREAATTNLIAEVSDARAIQEVQGTAVHTRGASHASLQVGMKSDAPPSSGGIVINGDSDGGEPPETYSFSLLGSMAAPAMNSPRFAPSSPFQYFTARSKPLSAAENPVLDEILHIRACIKSVAGFQFNTGLYLLKVIIEDCTETKEVSVDAKFVERLMGVTCMEFMRAMQATPAVAHRWAAQMQFALMTLEGIMEFRMNPNGTFTLLNCRDFSLQDGKALLQRVKASMSR